MPVLLAPLGLAALLAAVVPLLIHLARRTEERPVAFAALRWLRAAPRPRHRPRFDERWLLALRLLLIGLLAVWLAAPALPGSADRRPVTAFALGTTPDGAGRRLWLASGFPAVEAGEAPAAGASLASLIRDLDARLPAGVPLTLVVPDRLAGLDAERPRLSRRVTWRVVPGSMAEGAAPPAPTLAIRYAPERTGQARWWRAAAAAWGARDGVPQPVGTPLPQGAGPLVWLAGGDLPGDVRRWVERGGTVLLPRDATLAADWTPNWRDDDGTLLAEAARLGRGRVIRLTRELTPAAMPLLLDARFPAMTRDVLEPLPEPARALAREQAPLPGGPAPLEPVRDLRPWLGIALALLWLVERWAATRRARGLTP